MAKHYEGLFVEDGGYKDVKVTSVKLEKAFWVFAQHTSVVWRGTTGDNDIKLGPTDLGFWLS